jgi:hypothetical protein
VGHSRRFRNVKAFVGRWVAVEDLEMWNLLFGKWITVDLRMWKLLLMEDGLTAAGPERVVVLWRALIHKAVNSNAINTLPTKWRRGCKFEQSIPEDIKKTNPHN